MPTMPDSNVSVTTEPAEAAGVSLRGRKSRSYFGRLDTDSTARLRIFTDRPYAESLAYAVSQCRRYFGRRPAIVLEVGPAWRKA